MTGLAFFHHGYLSTAVEKGVYAIVSEASLE